MLTRRPRRALICLMVLGWGVLVASALPPIPWQAGQHLSVLAALVAGVGSLACVISSHNQPVIEVLEAGRAIGRAQALAEVGSDDVIRLSRRAHLRVVDEG